MSAHAKSTSVRGQPYNLRLLAKAEDPEVDEEWAVWRGKEFIGTLPYQRNETTKELEARSAAWISSLLG